MWQNSVTLCKEIWSFKISTYNLQQQEIYILEIEQAQGTLAYAATMPGIKSSILFRILGRLKFEILFRY